MAAKSVDIDIDVALLNSVNEKGSVDSESFAAAVGVDHGIVVGRMKSLCADKLIKETMRDRQVLHLTPEGKSYLGPGSPEAQVFAVVGKEGIVLAELGSKVGPDIAKNGMAQAMKLKWIAKDKDRLVQSVETICDEVGTILREIEGGRCDISKDTLTNLSKRRLVTATSVKSYLIEKGENFALERKKKAADLTMDMILKNQWKDLEFKEYNFQALGVAPASGHLHPLLKVRAEYRKIFLEMGFEEMPTNRYVESSFWNFDALFQPQAHPARDAHDTFFTRDPAETLNLPMEYLEKVKEVHERGGFGSVGYKYDWQIKEARKNLLRTHTTAISSQILYNLAQRPVFKPSKFFSIDRVFRNETLDATHLAEFHQVEGIIIDRNLGLGHLIGVLRSFFLKLGIPKLRFKPAYNPYTEPSMEIFSWHEGLGKWVEIGNSGVFRPEMLRPMGFPEDVSAIAWGLSVERPTMILYKLSNIRDLFGHKIDLQIVKSNPICRIVRDEDEDAARGTLADHADHH